MTETERSLTPYCDVYMQSATKKVVTICYDLFNFFVYGLKFLDYFYKLADSLDFCDFFVGNGLARSVFKLH